MAQIPEATIALFNTKAGYLHPSDGLTVLLPVRGNERNESLLIALDYILTQNMHPLEVIIIEEDEAPKIDLGRHKNKDCIRHLFLESKTFFNKSRAMNYGVASSTYDRISMSDVDMVLEKTMLWNIYNRLLRFNTCFPIREIYYLDELPISGQPFSHDGRPWTSRAKFYCHGGNVSFRKNKYIEIGGMNEIFVGHGSEDTEFYVRCKALTECSDSRFCTTLHMPHPVVHMPEQIDRNRKILDVLRKADQAELAKQLNKQFMKNWGDVLRQNRSLI